MKSSNSNAKENSFIISESCRLTSEIVNSAIFEIENKREKIKKISNFKNKKRLTENDFNELIFSKIGKLQNTIKTIVSQVEYFNRLWKSNSQNSNRKNCLLMRSHCREFIGTIEELENDWEDIYLIEAKEEFHGIHKALCGVYENIFKTNKEFFLNLKKAINSPKEFYIQNGKIKIDYILNDKDIKKLNRELFIKNKNTKIVQKKNYLVILSIIFIACILLAVLINPIKNSSTQPNRIAVIDNSKEVKINNDDNEEEKPLEIDDEVTYETPASKICKEDLSWDELDCTRIVNKEIWKGMDIDMLDYLFGSPDFEGHVKQGAPSKIFKYTAIWRCWDNVIPQCFVASDGTHLTSIKLTRNGAIQGIEEGQPLQYRVK
ncbi:MAG: hypothetical protein MNSN_05240 [Minisyncoccus archaeiphilus]|uniref:hypothetical protein n=1 Tax=Minisyncoccus archaeiphilus TaxID=3238481 RepID=UPI002B0B67CE|nr:MAG: hypothetical protein MNSN_05240 [Candidatus Parcubacteria bacterium]